MPSLFIGLVSHEGSRFAENQGEAGLAKTLAASWRAHGYRCEVEVNTHDAFDPSIQTITGTSVWRAVRAQLRLERSWRAYLREGSAVSIAGRARSWLRDGVVHAQAIRRYWRPWIGEGQPGHSSFRMIQRLFNIEFSHRHLMESGLASGSDWILIIEDDAFSADIPECVNGLLGIIEDFPECGYVNVSESFTASELGITHLLQPTGKDWRGHFSRQVWMSTRPVTNTVCAILYRREFLNSLVDELTRLPMNPIVPIDWKVNIALRDLYLRGALSSSDCLIVTPAPIDQLSMR